MKEEKFIPEINLNRESVIPLRAQIVEQMRSQIIRNRLPGGMKVVSESRLAKALEINRNTIHQAYEQLAGEGLLFLAGIRGKAVEIASHAATHYRNPFPALNLILPYRFAEQLKCIRMLGLEIVAGIMDRASELKISVNILSMPGKNSSSEEIENWLESFIPRSNGIITLGARSGSGIDLAFERLLMDKTLPHVFCSAVSDYPHISTVTVDYESGARQMTRKLYQLGHRHLGIIESPMLKSNRPLIRNYAYERSSIIRRVAEQQGITTSTLKVDIHNLNPQKVIREILHMKPFPTAFWLYNDDIAEPLADKFIEYGFRIPEDISIIGYDNTAQKYNLSSINHNRIELGAMAVDIVAELFEHGTPGDAVHRKVPSFFVPNATIASAKNIKETEVPYVE